MPRTARPRRSRRPSAVPFGRRAPRAPVHPHGREEGPRLRWEQAEARYRALAESLPIVSYVAALDVQGAFTYMSPQVEALLGFKPEEWISQRSLWLKRMHPEDRRRILPMIGKAHRNAGRFSAEYRLLDRDGRPKWIIDESNAVRDAAGRPLFILGTWTEITGRKKLETEAEGMGRELATSKSEIEQFVSAASHELKAPLRRIVNLGDLLALRCRGLLDAEAEGLLAQIKESASTMQELVAGLADYSEASREVPLSPVDMNLAARRARQELAEKISAAGAAITCGALPTVWAEPALLERVLYNLLDNAIKFRRREPPRIHVWAEPSAAGRWVVSVRDNGIGVHQRHDERIFSIFGRLNARREYAGVGLGLAVCRKIVDRFGGRIWIESEPGEGTTVHFTLRAPPAGDAA